MSLDLGRLRQIAGRLEWLEWTLWFGLGGWMACRYLVSANPLDGFFAVLLLTPGCFQLAAHRWAWQVVAAAWGLFFVVIACFCALRGWSFWRGVGAVCALWGLWNHYRDRPRFRALAGSAAQTADGDDPADRDEAGPNHSLVLWLREPMYLDESILGKIAARAFGLPFEQGENSGNFVVGKGSHYILKTEDALFLIHHWERNYFDDPEAAAAGLRELRRAEAVRSHRAWIAMDFMQPQDGMGEDRIHALIGCLLSELVASGAEVLAVFHPATGRIAPWEPALHEKLASASPLAVFEKPTNVPVLRIDSNSPAMVAAVAEARRRWPEFVAAFHAAADKDRFSVKAPVTEGGNTEFIWIGVKAIADGRIHGLLGNDPVALGNLKLGDLVSVAEADVNDWVCPDPAAPGRPLGLFTVRAVRDAGKA